MECIQLTLIDTESEHTGWRKPNKERQETLKNIFLGGQYGLSVSNGVQILEKESGLGQKIIDDGVSTVAALKACAAEYADDSSLTREGNLWPESLVDIFRYGLSVRVVAYTDDDDLESREAWNTAKHDEENNSVRWSSLHHKVSIVRTRYKRLSDWQKVKASLVELYGPGKAQTIGRWVRAGKGMDEAVFEALKLYEDLKGAYLWDNPYIVSSPSHTQQKLTSTYARKALAMLQERSEITPCQV